MITFALLCQKGGSGKPTLALHFAVEAATTGRRVLVLDLDVETYRRVNTPTTEAA